MRAPVVIKFSNWLKSRTIVKNILKNIVFYSEGISHKNIAVEMSCQRNAGRITVPDDLRDILLEFTISYLLEQPGDIIDFAVDFFTRLRDNRQSQLIQGNAQTCSSTPDESVEEGNEFINDTC